MLQLDVTKKKEISAAVELVSLQVGEEGWCHLHFIHKDFCALGKFEMKRVFN